MSVCLILIQTNNELASLAELFIIMGIIVFILLGISAGRSLWHIYKKRCIKDTEEQTDNKVPTKRRIKAIDAFRGYA